MFRAQNTDKHTDSQKQHEHRNIGGLLDLSSGRVPGRRTD
jgi:hypothetical protein